MKPVFTLISLLYALNISAQPDSIRMYHWDDFTSGFNADTVYGLSLSRMKLTELPQGLDAFKYLVALDLSKNKLARLPAELANFENLEYLNVEKNHLGVFPVVFCRMPKLKELVLNRNEIEGLPNCIELMTNLQYLDLYDNPIRKLPESLVQLNNLKEIDFSGIRFSPTFQEHWKTKMINVNLIFDAPCDCME